VEDLYETLTRRHGIPTMNGKAHSEVPVEVMHRKPRTLVLCFDGTSNEFSKHVRHAVFSCDISKPTRRHDGLEYERCQALFHPEEGRPRIPAMLLPGAHFIYACTVYQPKLRD
jgi:hypothetical protein